MEMKKIVWAYDGSRESEEALNYAVYIAQKFGSGITGIHVIPLPEKLLSQTEFHEWTSNVEERINSHLSAISARLTSQGLRFKAQVIRGAPSSEIVQLAERESADLIVIGKRGQGLIDRMLTGSTALGVLRESNVPVLTVKKRDNGTPIDIKNILVPLDISEDSDSAFRYAIDLADRLKGNLMVVYIFTLYAYEYEIPYSVVYIFTLYAYEYEIPYSVFNDLLNTSSEMLARKVAELRDGLGESAKKVEVKTEVIQGLNRGTSVADYALRVNTDLIVMNTHGRKGIKKFILGSVTEKVVHEASCPVLALTP